MYKAIIIDDEEMARVLLQQMLAAYCPQVDTLGVYADLPAGVKAIKQHKPDIVFLDIEMPGYSGLELLDFFKEDEIDFSIIFVTAYNNYAIQAFKLSAVDYLLKPIETDDLINAVKLFEQHKKTFNLEVLKHNLGSSGVKKIALSTLSQIYFVDTQDIMFFKAEGAYTKVCLKDGREILVSKGLKTFETILAEVSIFLRCHKSYIVNLSYVTQYLRANGGSLLMADKYEVDVSPLKVAEVLARLGC
ncbi:LytTR family DNA-binding domain-containing protein [Pedobacter sp. UBA4863]|uniref:LytR/AlgR family response regulator transcription factor n=1 Tax=Pedobacter sp. UBA4863 TaxID=1947060 RepID=UPI0025FBB8E4|nr:LytTR family DNA-binding domain-containing protein [Pedobacter sp. UBA4863]